MNLTEKIITPDTRPDLVWILPGFAIGSRPYAHQRPGIVGLGIQTVVSLHPPTEIEAAAWEDLSVRFLCLPTPDWVEIPAVRFNRVAQIVVSCLSASSPVLLHCLAGLNRAPTFAAAVLCRTQKISVDEALAAVMGLRTAAKPTPEQVRSLRLWAGMAS